MKDLLDIIIVDDHTMFRNSLKFMLEGNSMGRVIAEAEDGEEFLKIIETKVLDIVLMDIDMPVMNGIVATQKAIELYPKLKIIALSMYGDDIYFTKMLSAGAKGFLLKKSGIDELKNALDSVSRGESYFSNELLRRMVIKVKSDLRNKTNDEVSEEITEREYEILQLIANGLSTNEIADKCFLSPNTINNYRSSLMAKTRTKNSVDLVIYSIKNGLISI